MATDDTTRTTATFEDIDWENQDTSAELLGLQGILEVLAFAAVTAAALWDYYVVEGANTIFGVLEPIPVIGLLAGWDVTSVEWMMFPVLIMMFFHLVLPLAQNRRMTAYYWRNFKKNKVAVASLVFLIVVFLLGMLGPAVIDPPTVKFAAAERLRPPVGMTATTSGVTKTGTWAHPLGTTYDGYDLFTLIVYGMRVSMEVGLIAMVTSVSIGSVVGTTAAYATSRDWGMVDEALMRYVDLQAVFPVFMLLLLLTYLFGSHLWMIILLFGVFSWEGIARTVRGEALQRTEAEYIQAAQAAGANTGWIIKQHLIPNTSNSILTLATLLIPGFILGEASLSFLGFGDPTTFSWGRTVANGRDVLDVAPWVSTVPGIFLFFTVLAFSFVGDAARDALDPRQEKEE